MIRNVKKSHGFREIEQAINDMIENIQKIKKDRQANLSTLKGEKEIIEKEILQSRSKIDAQLDNLQHALLRELYEVESKESEMIGQFLDLLEKNENEIKKYQENLDNIKQHASELQTFLAMKQLKRDVADKEEYFTSFVESNKLNRVSLSCKMNDVLQNSCNDMKKLGEIIMSTHSSDVEIVQKRGTQAQTVVAHPQPMSIEFLTVVFKSTVDAKLKDIRGCTMLPDGRIVFTSRDENFVRGFNSNGSIDFDINVLGAFDITYLHDNNTIAISSVGDNKCLSIIDIESRKVKQIPIQSLSNGIVSRNNTLIYCVPQQGLHIKNLSDNSVNKVVKHEISLYAYVAAFDDKLYYTNRNTHTVTCCDLRGTTQWEFKDESVLSQPYGISADNAGNVYVAGYKSNNVVVISSDGQRHRQLLSGKDGFKSPIALHYDRSTNQLLLADGKGKAFLFRLE